MSYATRADAINLYGTEYVLSAVTREGSPSTRSLEQGLEEASSEIDSYAAIQYTTPMVFTTVPASLKRYCIDIAIYVASADAGSVTEEKRKRYEDAIAWCKMLAKEQVVIPGAETPAPPTEGAASASAQYVTSPRLFSRTNMDGL